MENVEGQLLQLIGQYPEELQAAMGTCGFDAEINPGNLVLAQYKSEGQFGQYLDQYSGVLSATGNKPKVDFTKVLNTALGVVTAAQGVNNFIKANKANNAAAANNPAPGGNPGVQVSANPGGEKKEEKLFGMPKGLAILAIVTVVALIGLGAVMLIKRK